MEEEEEQTLYMSLEYIDSPDCKPAENKCDIIISKSELQNTKIFTEVEFDAHRRECILKLQNEMGLSENLCTSILEKNGWDLSKAMADALENPDYYPPLETKYDPDSPTKDKNGIFDCPTCWEPVRNEAIVKLPCSHSFCESCLKQYINANFQYFPLRCLEFTCRASIEESIILKYISVVFREIYDYLKNEDAIKKAKNISRCPAANCKRLIQLLKVLPGANNIRCECGVSFCSECKELSHKPATCEMVKYWKTITHGENLTELWIAKHTKKCPFCAIPIEKNGGCMHLKCVRCSFEFCWICLQQWNDYHKNEGVYKCPVVSEHDLKNDNSDLVTSTPDWEKICQETSVEKCQKVASTFKELQSIIDGHKPADFLADACNIVIQSKRALKIADLLLSKNFDNNSNPVRLLKMNIASLTKLTEFVDGELDKVMSPDRALETLVTVEDEETRLMAKFHNFQKTVCTLLTKKIVTLCNSVISDIEKVMKNQKSIEDQKLLAAEMSDDDFIIPDEYYQEIDCGTPVKTNQNQAGQN